MDPTIAIFVTALTAVFALVVALVALKRTGEDYGPVLAHAVARLNELEELSAARESVEREISGVLADLAESDEKVVADGLLRKLETVSRTMGDIEQTFRVTITKLGERLDRLESLAMNRPVLVRSGDREGA